MAIPGLTIIGERINPGFKSSKELLDSNDIEAIQQLAIRQVEKGAGYLNINIGERALKDADYMIEINKAVQDVVDVPLSFDFPNFEVQKMCLENYDINKSGGRLPIVNSISEMRWEMLELLKIRPFKAILMASERVVDGESAANTHSDEVYETARRMAEGVLQQAQGMSLDDLFIDVSVAPIGADIMGMTRMAVDAINKIGSDENLKGIHMSVGLSNISVMLPSKAIDGSPLKTQIESAFLTLTVPKGLDTIIGTAGRNYELLPDDNLVMRGVREAIDLEGYDTILRIQEMYKAA